MKSNPKLLSALAVIGSLSVIAVNAQTTPGPQPTICARACWSARAASGCSTMSALNRVIVHHTAAASQWNSTGLADSAGMVRGLQNYNLDVNGYCDIEYHWMLDKHGNIFEARYGGMTGALIRGAHDGNNLNSHGASLMGYFHTPYNHQAPAVMLNQLYALIAWRMPAGWTPYGSGTYNGNTVGFLDGHRKVKATACPGDLIHPNLITENYFGGTMRTAVAQRRTPAVAVIVDNNSAGFSASASWILASSSADKYGPDYRYRSTAAISDAATWTGNLASTKNYNVYAWWSQGANRSATAAYHIVHPGGTAVVTVNQQANGGKWNLLGTWGLNAGSNQVKLSCWTTTGYVVLADAIQWQ
jgi:hypothetical protein